MNLGRILQEGRGEKGVSYQESIDEALCVGGSTAYAKASMRALRHPVHSPSKNSPWSNVNIEKVKGLIERRQMTQRAR